ncbi:Zinc finger protein RFP-like, partial [Homarus americanus]
MLPCGHTFCCVCLASVGEEMKGLTCPTCRSTHLSLSSHHLPVNYTVLDLSQQSGDLQVEEQRGLCSSHGEPLCYWCRECAVLVCGHCLLDQHLKQGHDVLHAADFVLERKSSIQARVQHLQAVFRDSRTRTRTCLHHCLVHLVSLCHESKNVFDLDDELFRISSEAKNLRDVEAVLISETRLRSLHRRGTSPALGLHKTPVKKSLETRARDPLGGSGAAGGT